MALFALVLFFEFDGSLGAAGDLLKRELDLGLQIETAVGPRLPRATRCACKRPAQNVVEHREDVADVHVREVVRALHALVAVLIITGALAVVGEHFVGFSAFLEANFRLRLAVAIVAVGVILHRQPAIRALNLFAAGGFGDAEDFVIVSLDSGHVRS